MEPEQIEMLCDEVSEQTGSRIPRRVRQLLQQILEAIEEEPDPSWEIGGRRPSPDQLTRVSRHSLSVLYLYLMGLANRDENREQVGYFSVLHGISELVEKLCPFKKNGRG